MKPDLELVAAALGTQPLRIEPAGGGGYTRSASWRVETADGTAFIKQAEEGGSLEMLRREAVVYEWIEEPFLPAFVGFADSGERAVLAIEFLEGALWPPPYPHDTSPLFAALEEIAATPAPPGLPVQQPRWSRWQRVADDATPLLALDVCSRDWLEGSLNTLIAAEARADFTGEHLSHSDIYCDNVCFAGSRAVLVDWGAARRGSKWVDVAQTVLDIREAGGVVPAIDFPCEDAFAAAVAGYLAVEGAAPLPEWISPESTFQEDMKGTLLHALRWTAEILELPPLP